MENIHSENNGIKSRKLTNDAKRVYPTPVFFEFENNMSILYLNLPPSVIIYHY
jgi:hypothetical protein